jgi:hypothetical protein
MIIGVDGVCANNWPEVVKQVADLTLSGVGKSE